MGGSHSAGLQQLGQVSMAQASVRAHTCFCVRGQARVAIWVLLPVKGCARFRWSVAKALMIQARIIHAKLFGIFFVIEPGTADHGVERVISAAPGMESRDL